MRIHSTHQIQTGVCLALVSILLLPGMSLGHSLYIQSSRYKVSQGEETPLFFCYGHHFPVDDGVRANKLKSVQVHKPEGQVQDIEIRNEICLHSYMIRYDRPGTYTLTAETNPGYYTVYLDKKGRKRHTIKPKSAIVDRAREVTKSLYSKQSTKTYVVCEEPSRTFPRHIGLPLELVPRGDLTNLKAGETLELEVFFEGQPYAGQGTWDATLNGFSTQAEDNFYPKTKVSGDVIRIPIPHPGRWYVRYFIKVDAQGDDLEQYTRMKRTATLVFQIPSQAKRTMEKSH
jgi:uncharacterized GH25 family protein